MAYKNYLNILALIYRPAANVQDALGDPIENPFVLVGTFRARMRNLSGNQVNYLERSTVEDFQRIYTTKNAIVRELDIVRLTEKDGTVIGNFSVRRIVEPERVRKQHHTELDVVGYDVDFTVNEADFPTVAGGFPYTFPLTLS